MKSLPAALLAEIDSATGAIAWLVDITLAGGGVLRYTNWDVAITYDSNSYTPRAFDPGDIDLAQGERANSISLSIDDVDDGAAMRAAALNGSLKGQSLVVYFCMPDASNVPVGGDSGVVKLFGGRMGGYTCNLRTVDVTAEGWLKQLNRKVPYGTFGPACRFAFRSTECGYTHADAEKTAQVADAGCTTTVIQDTARTEAADWWAGGWLRFTSGDAAGISMRIKSSATGTLTLAHALPAAPASGDTYNCYQGCDKSYSTCDSDFSNSANFGGFLSLADLEER